MVCAAIGLDAGSYSFGYVAGWAGGGDQAIAGIKAAGANIHRASNLILSQLEAADVAALSAEAA